MTRAGGANAVRVPVGRLAAVAARLRPDETTILVALAVVVGVLGGYGAIAFRWMVQLFQGLAIGRGEDVVALLAQVPAGKKVLLPVAGAVVVGPLVHFLAREAKGHGVPEVINAIVFRNGVIRPIVAAVKITASAVTIGCGGSVGREGPIVQIGAALGSALGQTLRLSAQRLRTLIGCGAAAGIAATFNAPIAGAFFALEIILRDFALGTLSPIVVASVIATAISRHHLGDNPSFPLPPVPDLPASMLPWFLVMGLIAGLLSVIWVRSLYWSEGRFDRIRVAPWLKPVLGAVPLGLLFLWFPQVYGIGYATMTRALAGELPAAEMALLVPVKLLAVCLTLGAGFSGGVFAPSLFLGGMLGGVFGAVAAPWLPGGAEAVGAFAMVGMAAVVGASTRGPIMAIVMLFEMTGEYRVMLPLILACVGAVLVSRGLMADSIFTLRFSQQGRRVEFGRESAILQSWPVEEAMEANPPRLPLAYPFSLILRLFLSNRDSRYYVVDEEGRLAGQISIHDVKEVLHERSLGQVLIAADLMVPVERVVHRADTLDQCLLAFGETDADDLPVLDSPARPLLVGVVTRRAVFDIYGREVLHKDVLGIKLVREASRREEAIALPEAYQVKVVATPAGLVGRTLRDLQLRQRQRLVVLAVRPAGRVAPGPDPLPDPDRPLAPGDRLVLVGHADDLTGFLASARATPPGPAS